MADRVTVIGWDGSPLTDAARSALGAATLVAGAAHHLALPEVPPAAERIRLGSVALAARRIVGHRGTAVVLADGDPGFFGVVRTLRAPEHGLEVEVVPAVSSVAAAFARAGMPWDDARIVTAHSRDLRRAVNVCRAHTKVAVLTSPGAGPAELALLLGPVHRTFVICEALGTDQEQVTVLTSDKVADHTWRDPNVVISIGGFRAPVEQGTAWIAGGEPGAGPSAPRGWALSPHEHGGPFTEAETGQLRAAQLARLGPRVGDLVWDIGAGSGAASVETARFGAAVIAVDRHPEACERTAAAARRHGVQLQVVHSMDCWARAASPATPRPASMRSEERRGGK
ncbi:precorrin-6y C5,15-methyltransferase (decarboxylating) subunit CbiE, partial [Streptomyces sp. NPDC048845]|uniref:precorrin-6y C5,15-methyltransferase (decarboxylating) subunit CbiE n=1 Tax=Streptomyces sp. NPDC048845 TaxID=3155390 RepID=UPI003441F2B3